MQLLHCYSKKTSPKYRGNTTWTPWFSSEHVHFVRRRQGLPTGGGIRQPPQSIQAMAWNWNPGGGAVAPNPSVSHRFLYQWLSGGIYPVFRPKYTSRKKHEKWIYMNWWRNHLQHPGKHSYHLLLIWSWGFLCSSKTMLASVPVSSRRLSKITTLCGSRGVS